MENGVANKFFQINNPQSALILDVKNDILEKNAVLNKIQIILNSTIKKPYLITPINLELIMMAQKNNLFKEYLNSISNLNTVDGVGIINVLKWYNINIKERVCGSDLVYEIAELCMKNNKRFFILGASEEVSLQAKVKLQKLYPKLEITNYSPPYTKEISFSHSEVNNIKNKIRDFKPDVLCVAFGAPKQELFIYDNYSFFEKENIKICIGLGGSFDFIAGKVKRAPDIFKKTGNEWLYRLLQEPKIRFKRQMTTIPLYYYLCAKEYFSRKRFK